MSEKLGPLVDEVKHTPHEPTQSQPIVVTAEVVRTLQDVSGVELVYRVMFDAEVTTTMLDDGLGPDQQAGDGIYTGTIPGEIAQPGDMIRWFVCASDLEGTTGVLPQYEVVDTNEETPKYFGALVVDPSIDAELPVSHGGCRTRAPPGTRAGKSRRARPGTASSTTICSSASAVGSTANNPVGKTDFNSISTRNGSSSTRRTNASRSSI